MQTNRIPSKPAGHVSMPFYECADGIYEIDEFDCVSVFVVVGRERALVLDCGTGIGDLRWLIEHRITNKPYDVLLSHNHGDHMGGAPWFDCVHLHPADFTVTDVCVAPTLAFRQTFASIVRAREHKEYPYDPETDIRPWPCDPVLVPLADGAEFNLGGRTVTAFHCPGHTPGEMVFLDDRTRTMLCGDACNGFFLLSRALADDGSDCIRTALVSLNKLYDMRDRYDRLFNFHHDYRLFGHPLPENMLPDLIEGLQSMLDGSAEYVLSPNPLSVAREIQTMAKYRGLLISSLAGGADAFLK